MNLQQNFLDFIQREKLFSRHDGLLVAVSGGVDSVVLCELLHRSKFQFVIAHCNFQLRAEESTRDEHFVATLGEKYQVPVLTKKFHTDEYAKENKLSIQVAARQLRYEWFEELIEKSAGETVAPVKYLLTAHHVDDNIETMLMNFFKGTGITGLRAMLPRQRTIVRPLLFAHKKQLLDYAAEYQLDFVQDSSNESNKYTRNYFRNELLPAIGKVFPAVMENLADNLQRFRQTEEIFQQAIDQHKKKLLEFKGSEIHIPLLKLKKIVSKETVLYEILRDYGFSGAQAVEVVTLIDAESGKFVAAEKYRVIKNRNWLIIAPANTGDAQTIPINPQDQQILFEKGHLEIITLPASTAIINPSNNIAQLDAATISFPLLLRKRRQADYFYPLGMQKKKKLGRFLGDCKLSVTEKEKVWVLEMNKKIVWVTGLRIDDRFKVTPKTTEILQLTFTLYDPK